MSVTSLVLGIIAVLIGWYPCTIWVAWILAVVGLVLGIIGTASAAIGLIACLACLGCSSCGSACVEDAFYESMNDMDYYI